MAQCLLLIADVEEPGSGAWPLRLCEGDPCERRQRPVLISEHSDGFESSASSFLRPVFVSVSVFLWGFVVCSGHRHTTLLKKRPLVVSCLAVFLWVLVQAFGRDPIQLDPLNEHPQIEC